MSEDRVSELLSLPAVTAFLERSHQPREAAEFARLLARYETGEADAAESVELLLLSSAGDDVLVGLLKTLHDDRPATELALGGFISACRRSDQDERHGQPLVLTWYARASEARTPAATGIVELWRTALGSRGHTRGALDVLRRWVLSADRDPGTEWALAALLSSLTTTSSEHQRLSHLLRTMPGEDGTDPPPVAGRLLAVLPHP